MNDGHSSENAQKQVEVAVDLVDPHKLRFEKGPFGLKVVYWDFSRSFLHSSEIYIFLNSQELASHDLLDIPLHDVDFPRVELAQLTLNDGHSIATLVLGLNLVSRFKMGHLNDTARFVLRLACAHGNFVESVVDVLVSVNTSELELTTASNVTSYVIMPAV